MIGSQCGKEERATNPAFGFDVVHLVIGALSDDLTAPQLTADLSVGVAHGHDRQEVRHDRDDDVVSENKNM